MQPTQTTYSRVSRIGYICRRRRAGTPSIRPSPSAIHRMRPALVHQQDGRWIAYVGHHGGVPGAEKPVNPLTRQPEFNGTSLIDVTDPAHPKYLAHIPG